ncbi:hypothetical protein IC582_018761 [Cucumis melo]
MLNMTQIIWLSYSVICFHMHPIKRIKVIVLELKFQTRMSKCLWNNRLQFML